jgi:uncharacterized membrane protein YqgA involved in biofilm formation
LTGTLINAAAVVAASVIGTCIGKRMPDKVRVTTLDGLGLVTTVIGLQMALQAENFTYVLAGVVVGALVGEALDIDALVNLLGQRMEHWVIRGMASRESGQGRFARGFVAASLMFCVGPMAIMGSLQDGLLGDIRTLTVKSTIDAFASLAFASSLGIGVAFSALPLLVYQGALTLGARMLEGALTESAINNFTATGGLLVFAIGLSLLEVKKVKVANLLPAVFVTPLIAWVVSLF